MHGSYILVVLVQKPVVVARYCMVLVKIPKYSDTCTYYVLCIIYINKHLCTEAVLAPMEWHQYQL